MAPVLLVWFAHLSSREVGGGFMGWGNTLIGLLRLKLQTSLHSAVCKLTQKNLKKSGSEPITIDHKIISESSAF